MTTTTFTAARDHAFELLDLAFGANHHTPDGIGWVITGLGQHGLRGVVVFSDEETKAFLVATLTLNPFTGEVTHDNGLATTNPEDAAFAALTLINTIDGVTTS